MIANLINDFYQRLWNAWDDGSVDATLSPDFVFRGSLGQETRGRDEWRGYRDMIRAGSADFHNAVVTLVCDGCSRGPEAEGSARSAGTAESAAARLDYTGTHTGTLLGLPPTGRRFAYAGAAFFTSDGSRLTSAWVLGDVEGLRRQLR